MQGRLSIRVAKAGAITIAILVCGSYVFWLMLGVTDYRLGPWENLFNLGSESNVPTWISTIQLFATALVCWRIRDIHVEQPARSPSSGWWTALAALFAIMSFDEVAKIHERVGASVRGIVPDLVVFRHSWVLPGVILVVVVAAASVRFLKMVPHGLRNRLLMGGALFVLGAVGFEVIDGLWQNVVGPNKWYRFSANVAEETSELTGVLICLVALLNYAESMNAMVPATLQSAADRPINGPSSAAPRRSDP
ncbi:MAG: hypothetical protein ACR2PK_10655 [Acidimicrobiales bacterium]